MTDDGDTYTCILASWDLPKKKVDGQTQEDVAEPADVADLTALLEALKQCGEKSERPLLSIHDCIRNHFIQSLTAGVVFLSDSCTPVARKRSRRLRGCWQWRV